MLGYELDEVAQRHLRDIVAENELAHQAATRGHLTDIGGVTVNRAS
jgi:hypothetical protein